MTFLNRRQFLKCSATASLALLPCSLLSGRRAGASPVAPGDNYYLSHRKELTGAFQDVVKGASQLLEPDLGPERTGKIARDALAGFDVLLPELPDVGGQKNLITSIVPIAAWYVALYGPMRENGKTAEDVGRIIYELNRLQFQSMSEPQSRAMSERLFSPKYVDKMREWASWTQKKEYPANWVARFEPGAGTDFDYGVDYTECALVKYFNARRVPELAPYVCLNDFPSSRAYQSGLRRAGTIAMADNLCDFRYKKGRAVIQDWSTEIIRIRQAAKG
jgi:hypothetical protein